MGNRTVPARPLGPVVSPTEIPPNILVVGPKVSSEDLERAGKAGVAYHSGDQELFDQVHRALTYLGACYEECSGMGSTLSLAWFTPGWMYFAM